MQKLKNVKSPENPTRLRRIFGAIFAVIATARNAFVVVIGSVIAYYAQQAGQSPFILTGTVRSGLPNVSWPPFSTTIDSGNGTVVEMGFIGMVRKKLDIINTR